MEAILRQSRIKEHPLIFSGVVIALTILITIITMQQAHAGILEDLNQWIIDVINGLSEAILVTASSMFENISVATALTAPFNDLFGDGQTSQVYLFAQSIATSVIKPVGHSILALVMLLQLIKISQKSESSEVMPHLRDIIFLIVFYALFLFLINNAGGICEAIYNAVLNITIGVQNTIGVAGTYDMPTAYGAAIDNIPEAVIFLIFALIFVLIAAIAFAVTLFVSYARAIQLYVMTAFSPIPFALLGFEETRSWGTGYIKAFISVCLAGTIMVFILMSFPLIMGQMTNSGGDFTIISMIRMIVIALLLIISLVKTGGWARDILGG